MNPTSQSYALALANHGFKVLPCCWPDTDGKCACGWDHDEKTTGKAPRIAGGVNAASSETKDIWQWWHDTPGANVAIALDTAYIMLDPDSPEALAEVEALGVPPTLTRISRNKAFIFKVPPGGVPSTRIVHRGQSGAIDVFTNGYCIAYGLHRTGATIYFEDPTVEPVYPPEWLLDWIYNAALETKPQEEPETDGPPVRLKPRSLEWWTGDRTVTSPAGMDRSATLFRIGLELGRANASETVIADALAERDMSLGYNKFSDRADSQLRYREMAAAAVKSKTADNFLPEFREYSPMPPSVNGHISTPATPLKSLRTYILSDVQPKPVSWLWDRRFPLGKLCILAGDPGLGKSYMSLDIAARISIGAPWPDGSGLAPLGNALIISVEDGLADTIRPRLDKLDANLDRIKFIDAIVDAGEETESLSLTDHLALMEAEILSFGSSLLILDPLLAFTGKTKDTHKSSDVRAVLAPLAIMADRCGCTILAIMHLNKKAGEFNSIHRITASGDFTAAARSVQLVGKHPEIDGSRIFAPVKMNLSADPQSLQFTFDEQGVFTWGGLTSLGANDVLAVKSDDEKTAREVAKDFLIDVLTDGPKLAKEVWAGADANGISKNTLRRAADDIGVYIRQTTGTKNGRGSAGWIWDFMPSDG